jgi:hypothetical protein
MGDTRNPSALLLEERNSVGVGTFQPSFGFKDFHHAYFWRGDVFFPHFRALRLAYWLSELLHQA